MKYLKLFQTIADKQAATLDYPNTNYVVENSKASIEREGPEKRVIAVYNVTKTSGATMILNDSSNITAIIVDDVRQPSVTTDFTFDTTGEHTVKYEINSSWNGREAFSGCSALTTITIPDGVKTIGQGAFTGSALVSISIPSSVTSIERNAFQNCNVLTGITIPDSVTSIGLGAFYGCISLTNINIPDSVTSIDRGAFMYCMYLDDITITAIAPPTLGAGVFDSTNNCPIYVPAESVNAYKAASGWSDYASRIQAIQ